MIRLPVLGLLLCLLRLAERFCDAAYFAAQLQGLVQTYGRAACSGVSEEWHAWDQGNKSKNDLVDMFGDDQSLCPWFLLPRVA